jgi:hypothetical protein
MTTSTLRSSRVWFARFLFLAIISLASTISTRAAQEAFSLFNSFPSPASGLSYTDASPVSGPVPGVGTITSRHVALTNFSAPILLPGLSNSAGYNNANTRFDSESSLDGGATWAPYLGFGPTSLTLRHTNEAAGVRRFEMELTSQDIPVNGSYGAATVRESATLASLGELVVTATNGGLFYRGFVNVHLEVSVDSGASWYPLAPASYLELSGISGSPVSLSISKSETAVTICWQTVTGGEYQLQKTDALGGNDWVDVGLPLAGEGEACVVETLSVETNQFYRLKLSP